MVVAESEAPRPGAAALPLVAEDGSRRRGGVDGRSAERPQRELTAIGVDRHEIVAQERVAEDSVDAGTRIVQHDRHVAQDGIADLEGRRDGGWPLRAAAERL